MAPPTKQRKATPIRKERRTARIGGRKKRKTQRASKRLKENEPHKKNPGAETDKARFRNNRNYCDSKKKVDPRGTEMGRQVEEKRFWENPLEMNERHRY